jgi:hypothetical protein
MTDFGLRIGQSRFAPTKNPAQGRIWKFVDSDCGSADVQSAIRNPQFSSPPAGLTHAGDLTFPAGRTAPRNRRLLGGIRGAPAEESAECEREKREDGFLERGHD